MKVLALVLSTIIQCLEVVLLTSPSTPFPIHDVLLRLSSTPGMFLSVFQIDKAEFLYDWDWTADLYLDYTYRPELYRLINSVLEGQVLVGMHSYSPVHEVIGRTNTEEIARQIADFLYEKNLTNVFLAYSTPRYQSFAALFNSSISLTNVASLPEELTEREVEQFVGRLLKPSGSTTAVLYVDERTGVTLISQLKLFHIYKEGFLYFVSDEAAWGLKEEGLLYFTDSAAVSATDRVSYEALVLADRLKQLAADCISGCAGAFRTLKISISLVNISNGKPVSMPNYSDKIIFPGNSTILPTGKMPVIEVWADIEAKEANGHVYKPWKAVGRGTLIGYAEANRRHDLTPTFQFSNRSVSFGSFEFNKTWAVSQILQARTQPGIAYHAFLFTSTVISLYKTLQELGLSLPMTAISISSALTVSADFPMFVRTMSSLSASALVMSRFFAVFGWKRVAVVYSTGMVDLEFYGHFRTLMLEHHIEIVNSESTRRVPLDLLYGQKELNDTLLDIMNSTVRIIVISHSYSYQVVSRLYDLGAKVGDYEICLSYLVSSAFSGNSDLHQNARKLMKGAMLFGDRFFGGKDGPFVRTQLQAADGPGYDWLACVNYDSAMLVAHAVDYMLYKGLHFEQGTELIKVMRATRFNGCLGTIQIESGTNDIRLNEFSLMNVHPHGENNTLVLVEAAIYSPTRMQLYTILPELRFSDGSNSSFSDSWVPDTHCPYLRKDIQDFPAGKYLAIGLNFGFVVLMIVFITVGVLIKQWKIDIAPLTDKQTMNSYDGYTLITLLIEFIQILLLGPTFGPLSLRNAIGALALDVWELVHFGKHVFIVTEITVFTVICFYLLLYCVRIERLYVRYKKCFVCKILGLWSKKLVQPINRLLSFSLVSVLLSTFVCDQSTGPAFSDSFLAVDCWERCWQGRHLRLAIISAVLLCLYTPLAILSRPLWQDQHPTLHVRGTPIILLSKGLMQLTLIATFVCLRSTHPKWHANLYFSVCGVYTTLILLLKPYNYERINLWERLSMLAVCGLGIISVLRTHISTVSNQSVYISLVVAYTLLLFIGLIIQCIHPKYKSLLERLKEDRSDIIKFAFTFGTSAQRHLQAFQFKCRQSKDAKPIFLAEPTRLEPRRIPLRVISVTTQ